MVSKSVSRVFPGFDFLYLLGTTGSPRVFRGEMQATVAEADALTRAELSAKGPVVISHYMGGAPKNVLWTTSGSPLIFHNRIIELLTAHRFTGWSTYPVTVHGKTGNLIEKYSGFAFKGRCGPIDDSRSEVVLKDYPGGKFPIRKGLYFDPESWDGSDFFMSSDGSLFQFVSQAVLNVFKQEKVTEIGLVKLTEAERPTGYRRERN
jgi:hypothetical protein